MATWDAIPLPLIQLNCAHSTFIQITSVRYIACIVIPGFDDLNLTINTDMATVVKAMASPDSGLEIRDRMWLKITIPNAFIGRRCGIQLKRACLLI